MRTRYTNIATLKADLAAEADSLPYMEGNVTLALPAIAMPPEAVAQIALDNLPGAGDPMRAWFTAYRTEGESIRHTPRGEGVMVQIDYQREDGPYPLGVLELLRLPGGTCAPAITAHPGNILALLPAIRTLADLLPGWNVRAVIDPPTEPARTQPRDEDAPSIGAPKLADLEPGNPRREQMETELGQYLRYYLGDGKSRDEAAQLVGRARSTLERYRRTWPDIEAEIERKIRTRSVQNGRNV